MRSKFTRKLRFSELTLDSEFGYYGPCRIIFDR